MMTSRRMDIVHESLVTGDVDKNLISIISNLTVQEWMSVIEQKNTDEGKVIYQELIPYLLTTYNEKIIMEMVGASSYNVVGRALLDAWFSVVYSMSEDEGKQPQFLDIVKTPLLLHLFEGHFLKVLELADFEEDVSAFITPKFKMMLDGYSEVFTSEDRIHGAEKLLLGDSTVGYPPTTDYDSDRLNTVNSTVCILLSLSRCIKSLVIDQDNVDNVDNVDLENIDKGKFKTIIKKNVRTIRAEHSMIKQFDEVYTYLLFNSDLHVGSLSRFMLLPCEQAILKHILAESICESKESKDVNNARGEGYNKPKKKIGGRGYDKTRDIELSIEPVVGNIDGIDDLGGRALSNEDVLTTKTFNIEPKCNNYNVIREPLIGDSSFNDFNLNDRELNEEIEASKITLKKVINLTVTKAYEFKKYALVLKDKYEQNKEINSDEAQRYEDILITGKKQGNGVYWVIGIALAICISVATAVNGSESENVSIIDKVQQKSGENSESKYKTIKIVQQR